MNNKNKEKANMWLKKHCLEKSVNGVKIIGNNLEFWQKCKSNSQNVVYNVVNLCRGDWCTITLPFAEFKKSERGLGERT